MLGAWGPFVFEAPAPSFDKLTRETGARWHDHEIIGRRPAGQYLGPAKKVVILQGVVFPREDGGAASLPTGMEAACEAGAVNDLVAGSGAVFGPYRLEKVKVDEDFHDANGAAGRIAYVLTFALHDEGAGAIWSLWP